MVRCTIAFEKFFEIMKNKDDSQIVQILLDPTVLQEIISVNESNNFNFNQVEN